METNDIRIRLGRFIRTRRRLKELSQEELAERAQLHPTYISRIESGKSLPAIDVLINLSAALAIAPWEVLKIVVDEASRNSQATAPSTGPRAEEREIIALLQGCTDSQLRLIKSLVEVVKSQV